MAKRMFDPDATKKKAVTKVKKDKVTVTKKMTLREYITLLWMFENPELVASGQEIDLSGYEQPPLAVESKYSFRLSIEQKEQFDKFFSKFVSGVSLASVLGKLKRSEVAAIGTSKVVVNTDDKPKDIERPTSEKKYPYVPNPNKQAWCDNFDPAIAFQMLEKGELKVKDITELLGNNSYRFYDLKIEHFKNVPEKYSTLPDICAALVRAEDEGRMFIEIMNAPEPSEEETMGRYIKYLQYHFRPIHPDFSNFTTMTDAVKECKDNTITLIADDGDEVDEYDLVYNNAADMKNDLIKIAEQGSKWLDPAFAINVFGKNTTLNKIYLEYYKKFPKGFSDDKRFYHTRKEAYGEGVLVI